MFHPGDAGLEMIAHVLLCVVMQKTVAGQNPLESCSSLGMAQPLHWDRGRPARNAGRRSPFRNDSIAASVFALRAHCGRDARGPNNKLSADPGEAQHVA